MSATPSGRARQQKGIRAIDVGMKVLVALAGADRPLALRDLGATTGLSASLLHRYLVSFGAAGMTEQDPDTGNYRLGPFALNVGLRRLSSMDAVRAATPLLRRLVEEIDQTSTLAVWGNQGPTVIRWEESSQLIGVNLRVGSVLPMLTTATGQIFAAFRPPASTRAMIDREIAQARRTGRGPATRAAAEALLDGVREAGIAIIDGALIPGVCAAAVPVFDHNGELVLAIASLGYKGLFDASDDGPVCSALRRSAAEVSRQLGFQPASSASRSRR